jgi:prepilin signal peptidase PulO-like enzyme (type II secretory pathway)
MIYLQIYSMVFGICIGSFLNALIYRMPRKITLFSSRSRSQCTKCGQQLSWYENIPLISWIFLLGKCRSCKTRIPIRYPAIELLVGIFAFVITPSNLSLERILFYLFCVLVFATFVSIFMIDLEFKIIPNELNIFLGLLFLVAAASREAYYFWLVGGLVGFFVPLSITYLFFLLKGQVGLGGGDIKLWGALGIYLGPLGVMHNLFMSCFVGALLGGGLILFKVVDRKTPIPFGPFIVTVASVQIFIPDQFNQILELLVLV